MLPSLCLKFSAHRHTIFFMCSQAVAAVNCNSLHIHLHDSVRCLHMLSVLQMPHQATNGSNTQSPENRRTGCCKATATKCLRVHTGNCSKNAGNCPQNNQRIAQDISTVLNFFPRQRYNRRLTLLNTFYVTAQYTGSKKPPPFTVLEIVFLSITGSLGLMVFVLCCCVAYKCCAPPSIKQYASIDHYARKTNEEDEEMQSDDFSD